MLTISSIIISVIGICVFTSVTIYKNLKKSWLINENKMKPVDSRFSQNTGTIEAGETKMINNIFSAINEPELNSKSREKDI